ncbi:transposase [Variovorax sp. B4]|uniref:transposase n=1 Tax=Variovorax sp. B4 TaxID=2021405 RepID=UPI001F4DE738|nr:transposase [Variovorax sp. B4]
MDVSLPSRDREGKTVDFRLSANRDVKAAKAFFRKALETQGRAPVSITLDGYAASHGAVRELPAQNPRWKDTRLRCCGRRNISTT